MNVFKKFCLVTLLAIPVATVAQKVTVSKGSERVKGSNIDGYAIELTGTVEEVNPAYAKYLKTFGKI